MINSKRNVEIDTSVKDTDQKFPAFTWDKLNIPIGGSILRW